LRRPDWGRRLHADSVAVLEAAAAAAGPVDLAIVAADGLSATAVQQHVAPLLRHLRAALAGGDQPALALAPVTIATQARVALADEVGALLQARLVLILLGERPGLSAPDSVGAYLTHGPQVGTTDAQRNCISNIRPAGLPLDQAAGRLAWLVQAALRRRTTGVALKDDSATTLLPP
jgi:ethanolamine ammonia-lyase small subunit